jgi:ubiquinol-cytochrome c reductase cytochrome b subunit
VLLARVEGEEASQIVGAAPKPAETEAQRARRLFTANCAACHSNTNEHGVGIAAKQPSAPNLHGFGSRQWLAGVLDPEKISGNDYFGHTRHAEGDMAGFVKADLAELDDEGKAKVQSIIAALSAEAKLPAQKEADAKAADDGTLEKGREALAEAFENSSCVDCHKFRDAGDLGSAPDLTGWASTDWLTRLITDPTHEAFYR